MGMLRENNITPPWAYKVVSVSTQSGRYDTWTPAANSQDHTITQDSKGETLWDVESVNKKQGI